MLNNFADTILTLSGAFFVSLYPLGIAFSRQIYIYINEFFIILIIPYRADPYLVMYIDYQIILLYIKPNKVLIYISSN